MPMQAQRGGGDIAPTHSKPPRQMRVGGQSHAPAALPPVKRSGTHCVVGWVGPRASLEGCGKLRPHRDSIPGPSSTQRDAIPTALTRPTIMTRGLYKDWDISNIIFSCRTLVSGCWFFRPLLIRAITETFLFSTKSDHCATVSLQTLSHLSSLLPLPCYKQHIRLNLRVFQYHTVSKPKKEPKVAASS